jgi:hypothetical protein
MWNESLEQNSLLTTFQLPSFRSITSGRSVSITFIMTNSRQSSTSTDDGGTHQSDNYSGSGTHPGSPHPFHPTTSILCLPKTSNVGTVDQQQKPIYLGSDRVPAKYHQPLSRTPSPDDRTMNGRDIEEYVKRNIEKEKGKRRAARNAAWNDQSETDDERRNDVPETPSAVSKTQGRSMSRTAPPDSSGISKKPRSGPVRRKTNEESGMSRGFSKRAGTRPGLRSRGKPLSQDTGTTLRDEETDGGLEGGVEQMLLDDQES